MDTVTEVLVKALHKTFQNWEPMKTGVWEATKYATVSPLHEHKWLNIKQTHVFGVCGYNCIITSTKIISWLIFVCVSLTVDLTNRVTRRNNTLLYACNQTKLCVSGRQEFCRCCGVVVFWLARVRVLQNVFAHLRMYVG